MTKAAKTESTAKVMTATTWVDKVLANLNITDEHKVILMHKTLKKVLQKQISIRKDNITKLKAQTIEELETMQEVLDEIKEDSELAFITVDVNRIKDVPSRKSYAIVLNSNFENALDKIEAQEKAMDELKENTEATAKAYQKEIDRFELKLSKI